MRDAIASSLGVKRQSSYIASFMVRSNMEVMQRVTPVVAVLSVVGLVSTFTGFIFWQNTVPGVMVCYRILFIAMIAVGLLFRRLSTSYLDASEPKLAQGEGLLLAFVGTLVAVNLWITIVDFAAMGRYFFLLVALFSLYGLFFIRPWVSVASMACVCAVTLGGLWATGFLSPVQIVTLVSYLVIILAVSISNHGARLRVAAINEQILASARKDELTGILNRRAFDEDAVFYIGHDVFVILADVDEFKYYNDWYGHAMGDLLLTSFAACMADVFGTARTYRFGGDEFIAVVVGGDEADVRRRIRDWQESFSKSEVGAREFVPSCSVGCVHGHVSAESDVQDLLRIADVLLYRSSGGGHNRVTFAEYSDGLLREAIANANTYGVPDDSIDELTGLLTREFFTSHVSESAPLLLQRGQSVDCVYVNVANLKDYNARYGYAKGDELLKYVAQVLREAFPGRLLARFGDDRFGILTDDESLRENFEQGMELMRAAPHAKLTSLRAGVYRYESTETEVFHAFDCARMACESLRGHYDVHLRYYTDEIGHRMARHHRVLERFESALELGHIQPFYQPIVRVADDRVSEFEVLARWIDPVEGMLSPADFIPALEEAHLIHLLDLHIVEQVCRNFRRWEETGHALCPVSVNFSRLDFEACDIASEVIGRLDRFGLPHYLIRVELTESAFTSNVAGIHQTLERFREAGMQVWMDDFGSGYSTLNTLREYSFDLIKFDMSFLRGMDARDRRDPSAIMLTKLVEMARELGLHTLIEGVETNEQLVFLRNIAFEMVQGYVYGRPASFEDVRRFVDGGTYVLESPECRTYYESLHANRALSV